MNSLLYQLAVYIHVIGAIFLTGYALFGVILALSDRSRADHGESLREVMGRAVWPPAPIPSPLRLHLNEIAWGSLIVMAATGVLAFAARDWAAGGGDVELAPEFGAKLALVGLLFVLQSLASRSPRHVWLHLFLIVTLAIVSLSALIAR